MGPIQPVWGYVLVSFATIVSLLCLAAAFVNNKVQNLTADMLVPVFCRQSIDDVRFQQSFWLDPTHLRTVFQQSMWLCGQIALL